MVTVAGTLFTIRRLCAGVSDIVRIVVDADLIIMVRLLRLAREIGGRLYTETLCTRLLGGNTLVVVVGGITEDVAWLTGDDEVMILMAAFGAVWSTFLMMSGVENSVCSIRGFLAPEAMAAMATDAAAEAASMRFIVCTAFTVRVFTMAAVVRKVELVPETGEFCADVQIVCSPTAAMPLCVRRRICGTVLTVVVGSVAIVEGGIAVTTRVPSFRTRIIRFWAEGRGRPAVLTTVRTVWICAMVTRGGCCCGCGGCTAVDVIVAGFW